MMISNLAKSISDNIEDLQILAKLYNTSHSITESESNPNTTLTKVIVENVPENNVWIFKSEVQDIECLRSQNSTVEETILYLKDHVLYAYMIELKSSLTRGNIKEIKKKFTCSLVTLTLYLANHPYFNQLTDAKISPVGVVMFNDNYFSYADDHTNPNSYSELQKNVLKFNFTTTNNLQTTSVQIKPVTLNRLQIPTLFFQNPDWIPTPPNRTNEFKVDFNALAKHI